MSLAVSIPEAPVATAPLVSVVVPTHGRPELLARLLRSLIAQEYPPEAFEIIIVHNVSNDDTERVVREIMAESPVQIRYFAKNYNGPMASRDYGAKVATGGIIAFIDDDCEAMPRWLAEGVRAMTPGVGLVQGRTMPRPDQPRRLVEKTIEIPDASPFFETCNIFYRKEALMQVGGFSEEFAKQRIFYGEDTDLGWKVKETGADTVFAGEALVHHEVFRATLREWLIEPRRMYVWPYLVKKHPGLREHMYLRYFLTKRCALFDLALLGVIAGIAVHPAAFGLIVPYIVYRLREPSRRRNPVVKMLRLIAGVPRAFVFFAVLAVGSVRYRSVLL